MKNSIVTIENDGQIVQRTNYYETEQAKRGEFYLTWNAGCGRLLIPDSHRHFISDMKCNHCLVTNKDIGIEILFDDGTDHPFRLMISHEQNDRKIEAGECLLSVYVRMGEKYQYPCKCVIEHGNTGNQNAKKEQVKSSQIQMRIDSREKAAYVKQAQRDGKKLTNWLFDLANAALDDDLKK